MKLYDISQEVFSCAVYPGDPRPQRQVLCSMEKGDLYSLTAFSMCAHNGTHVDAPAHFIRDGKTVDAMDLEFFVGPCFVADHEGPVTAEDAETVLRKADGIPRILIRGDVTVTEEAAKVFAESGICLLGNEGPTVGPVDAPMAVHKYLLGRGIALLEGILLREVYEGRYFLSAAPLSLAGSDGAPCRAYLIEGI